MDINKEIEEFYSNFEKRLTNYKRPVDYIERYLRVINGQRKPMKEKPKVFNSNDF